MSEPAISRQLESDDEIMTNCGRRELLFGSVVCIRRDWKWDSLSVNPTSYESVVEVGQVGCPKAGGHVSGVSASGNQ
jgi:hypothetical protein